MTIKQLFSVALLLALCAFASFGQSSLTTTTLSVAIADSSTTMVTVASATNLVANTWGIYVDKEFMLVRTISGTTLGVVRGAAGTKAQPHVSGATVYAGLRTWFSSTGRSGSCTAANETVLPVVNVNSGDIFTCSSNRWVVKSGYAFLGPGSCATGVSGNGTGTQQLTSSGASFTPVVQAQTSASGTNTHTFVCNLTDLQSRLIVGRGTVIEDVTFFYGVQTTGLGTQVATLASGTMNSAIVFSTITYPAAGASETPSTVTPVRADTGTLVITPVVASSNVATTTAGSFYSVKFTPASAIPLETDSRQLLFTVALLNTATSATITNSPGILVHYSSGI